MIWSWSLQGSVEFLQWSEQLREAPVRHNSQFHGMSVIEVMIVIGSPHRILQTRWYRTIKVTVRGVHILRGGEEEERRVEGGLVFAPTESHIHKQRLFPAQSAQYSVCRWLLILMSCPNGPPVRWSVLLCPVQNKFSPPGLPQWDTRANSNRSDYYGEELHCEISNEMWGLRIM